MKKVLTLLMALSVLTGFAADRNIRLYGRVKDSSTKADLTAARIFRLDSAGVAVDSVRANRGLTYSAGVIDTLSQFFIGVPRTDSLVLLEVR